MRTLRFCIRTTVSALAMFFGMQNLATSFALAAEEEPLAIAGERVSKASDSRTLHINALLEMYKKYPNTANATISLWDNEKIPKTHKELVGKDVYTLLNTLNQTSIQIVRIEVTSPKNEKGPFPKVPKGFYQFSSQSQAVLVITVGTTNFNMIEALVTFIKPSEPSKTVVQRRTDYQLGTEAEDGFRVEHGGVKKKSLGTVYGQFELKKFLTSFLSKLKK